MTPQTGYTRNSAFSLRDGDITYPPSMALLFVAFTLACLLPLPFAIVAWGVPIPARWWHQHEAVFGLGSGRCSGFLLTALPHWLGTKRPGRLAVGLFLGAWCAGRAGALTWAYVFSGSIDFWRHCRLGCSWAICHSELSPLASRPTAEKSLGFGDRSLAKTELIPIVNRNRQTSRADQLQTCVLRNFHHCVLESRKAGGRAALSHVPVCCICKDGLFGEGHDGIATSALELDSDERG